MYNLKITDEVRLVNTVCEQTTTYSARGPEHEARAQRIAAEAARWLAFATERTRMTPQTLIAKAIDAACFSVAVRAAGFTVPSKLSAVREHQGDLWALVRSGYDRYTELGFDTATAEGVRVTLDDEPIGDVQVKHVPWVRPLVRFGLRVFLSQVTGTETRGYTLGVNVIYASVDRAIAARTEALGNEASRGDGASGDGSTSVAGTVFPTPALPKRTVSGDGASGRLSLVVPAGHADPLDVVLYRDIDGTARATVAHTPAHSPTGFDWGRLGAGPADLAIAVLTAVACEDAAARHSAAFAAEVIACVPYAGGVLRAARVRDWLARQKG